MPTKIAVIQAPPVLLDKDGSIERATGLIAEAAQEGAALLVFPEAYVPGYPAWVWRMEPGGDMALSAEIHGRLRRNAVDLGRDELAPVRQAAARHGVTVVMGLHEVDGRFSGTTLYNTAVVIGPDGAILNRHRKLMPTNPERMVWGLGDASGLRVVETPVGRLGVLLCWESHMPLARYALYGQAMDVFVNPTWDDSDIQVASMRHIAKEAGAWVVSGAIAMQGADVPEDFPERDRLFPAEEWINDGNAMVVQPGGAIAAGPLRREKGILYAEIDAEAARRARRSLDPCGHYARPDVFSLAVNRKAMKPVEFLD